MRKHTDSWAECHDVSGTLAGIGLIHNPELPALKMVLGNISLEWAPE